MSTVNVAETVDVLTRVYRRPGEDVIAGVELLLASVVEPVPATVALASKAAELRARLYNGRTSRVSIADCFVLAVAEPGDRIATTDATLSAVARAEGYEVVELG
jgi:predicted nucleic acid-binding protein